IMAKLPVDNAEKFIIWMLNEFSDDGETVMAAPAEGFYATPGLGGQEIRMAYVLKEKDLKRAVELLAKGISQYPGRRSGF
ncbi:MAG: pyridoxal phosphate-dependent aminotransferase, partial [Thermovirgaceae bacterium]